MPASKQLSADLMLALVTLAWGSTFVLVKEMVEQVPPMMFLAVRFAIGGAALAAVTLLARRWAKLSLRELRWGTVIGVALWAGYSLQTLGLQKTTASNAGFITGLSVVLVPVIGLFILRHRPDAWTWLGVVSATMGLALLSLRFEGGIKANSGDLLVLGCALAFAIHILLVSRAALWCDPLRLTSVQVLVAGLLNALTSLLFEGRAQGLSVDAWSAAAFLGLVATAAAFLIQVTVQRFTTATHTALIFTLEPVFAATFGYWLAGDQLAPTGWLGAALILAGMLVAELVPYIKRRGRAWAQTSTL